MKKLMKWYVNYSVIVLMIYALVGFIGGKIIDKHPLKDEEKQNYAWLIFFIMRTMVMSPYYTIKWCFTKNEKVVE